MPTKAFLIRANVIANIKKQLFDVDTNIAGNLLTKPVGKWTQNDINVAFQEINKWKGKSKSNPPSRKPVMIYGRLLRIEAQKTQKHICDAACKKAQHRYFHDFSSRPAIYGSPDGKTLTIKLR